MPCSCFDNAGWHFFHVAKDVASQRCSRCLTSESRDGGIDLGLLPAWRSEVTTGVTTDTAVFAHDNRAVVLATDVHRIRRLVVQSLVRLRLVVKRAVVPS